MLLLKNQLNLHILMSQMKLNFSYKIFILFLIIILINIRSHSLFLRIFCSIISSQFNSKRDSFRFISSLKNKEDRKRDWKRKREKKINFLWRKDEQEKIFHHYYHFISYTKEKIFSIFISINKGKSRGT